MQEPNSLPWISDYLSLIGFIITVVGFAVTLVVSFRAKRAAEMAREAATAATSSMRRLDIIADIATVRQLIEEIKRLHRSDAFDLLPERYSLVRSRVISIRESGMATSEGELSLLQDIVSRVSSLEIAYDANNDFLRDARRLAKSNQSLSECTDALIGLTEKIRNRTVTKNG